MTNKLFEPLKLGAYILPNRIFMAPMTRNRAANNIPTEMMAVYYSQRAGAGLLVTEGVQISPQGIGYPATPGIHTKEQIEGWMQVTRAVHETRGHIFLQLWHVGRISHPDYHNGGLPVAPSAIAPKGEATTYKGAKPFVAPRMLETDEIPGVIEQYARAAENAKEAGFDGVEIHGANGYLVDEFLRDGSNQRIDRYGGSVENRAHFLLEITAAVSDVLGGNRVAVRLSPLNPSNDMHDSNPEAIFSYVTTQLNRFGLAYLHITEMGIDRHEAAGSAFDLNVLRKIWRGVYVTNYKYDRERSISAIENGYTDAVAFGRLYIANPDLAKRLQENALLNKPDSETFYGGDEHGYIDYPAMNKDVESETD